MTRVLKLFTRIKTCRRGLAFEYENRMNFGKQVRNCDTSGLRIRTHRSRDSTVIQEILKLWIAPLTIFVQFSMCPESLWIERVRKRRLRLSYRVVRTRVIISA